MRISFVSWDMHDNANFIAARREVEQKHGSLAGALRAGGIDPDSKEGRAIRRNIELKTAGTNAARVWDIWALRWLLSRRKKG